MSVMDELIYDRTASDVNRWRELKNKGWGSMTAMEKAEWLTALKGCYNHTDMNRVEQAVELLSARLSAGGYITSPTVKTNWTVTSMPLQTDWERYYRNVQTVRNVLAVHDTTPPAPTTKNRLTYQTANNIEKILADVNALVGNMEQAWVYAGDIFAAEV